MIRFLLDHVARQLGQSASLFCLVEAPVGDGIRFPYRSPERRWQMLKLRRVGLRLFLGYRRTFDIF